MPYTDKILTLSLATTNSTAAIQIRADRPIGVHIVCTNGDAAGVFSFALPNRAGAVPDAEGAPTVSKNAGVALNKRFTLAYPGGSQLVITYTRSSGGAAQSATIYVYQD